MKSSKNNIKSTPFNWPASGAGYVLPQGATPTNVAFKPVLDQNTIRAIQRYGDKIPRNKLDRTTGYSQISNLSHNFTMEKVQGALRAAENGDVRMYFSYLRDFVIGNAQVVSSLTKRKLATISEPYTILPKDKTNEDDVMAAKVIEELISKCYNFEQSLSSFMNAIIFPVAVCEKLYTPVDDDFGPNPLNLRYKLKEISPVDYNNITYRLPYIPQFYSSRTNVTGQPTVQGASVPVPPGTAYNSVGEPEDVIFDPDSWEPNLRFWQVLPNGIIIQSPATMIRPDPERHIVYRCDLLNNIARENFGGLGKSLLFLSIMSQLGLDVFLRCLQKYGSPFVMAKVDTSQVDTVNQLMEAFGQLNVLSAIAVNKDAEVELQEMNYSGAADAHTMFLDFINSQINLLINQETLSSHAKSTGLGSGQANLHGQVRQDVISYDRNCLSKCLETQLFPYLLKINGYTGNVRIVWGGSSSAEECKTISETIYNLYQSGISVDEDSISDLNTKFGFKLKINENVESDETKDDDSNIDNKEKEVNKDEDNRDISDNKQDKSNLNSDKEKQKENEI